MAKVPRFQQQRHHRHSNLEQPAATWSEGELYERLPEIEEPFLLILDCVQDPHNLGACLRSADAVGVHAVIIPKDKSAGITDVVRRVACGGAENTPVVQVTNLARCLGKLKELGVWLVGTADDGSDTLYSTDLSGPIGVVMGAEGSGIRRLTRENCDFLIQIPMAKTRKVDCLNVSVATGVVLFEARRQRLQKLSSSSSMTPTHG